jgi:hypothetical protein
MIINWFMNILELLNYIDSHIPFIDEKAPDLYEKFSLPKNTLIGLCNHPNPFRIPKGRRKLLYQLQHEIELKKEEHFFGEDHYFNDQLIEHQKFHHQELRPFGLRHRWRTV